MDRLEYDLRNRELEQSRWQVEYNAKAVIEGQGYKGLGFINGGAAVALGALLQAIINKPEAASVVPFILTGIAFNIIGVSVASAIFWVRYNQWVYEKQYDKFMRENPWWRWRWYLAAISLSCFVVGMTVVVVGGFTHLNIIPASTVQVQPASSSNKTLEPAANHPNCSGIENWPTKMAFVHLKNAGITDNSKLDFTKTKTLRIASEKIGDNLYRQLHHVTFNEKSGKTIEVITVNNASQDECSMSDVDVYLVSNHLAK